MTEQPNAIDESEQKTRRKRVTLLAKQFGFTGQIEYRHVFSASGGAQYGLGTSAVDDVLVVFAEAFTRDEDPEDFSLAAIVAHECGHQVVCRHARIAQLLSMSNVSSDEEVLASLVGSLKVNSPTDRESLVLKALDDAVSCGLELEEAIGLITELRSFLEKTL